METKLIAVIGVLIIVGAVLWTMGIYNGEVSRFQGVNAQWGNVETEYQKRFDLVPQLVNVVTGAASFEQETLTKLSALRTQWQTQTSVSQRIETANEFETTLSKLLVVAENYPTLQSNEQFNTLQIQLEGIENRISVERKRYNDAVREYNTYIALFPNALLLGGKTPVDYFNAPDAASNAPDVPNDFTNP